MQIHQSAEDYLETILMLNQRMGRVRSIDVVNELGYTKASVSIAMKKLRENGYIAVDGEGNLTLLEPGREIAERIYSRHRLLTHFFVQLGGTSGCCFHCFCNLCSAAPGPFRI
jgi:Mn-dependent DtxR family transcriptional regulator